MGKKTGELICQARTKAKLSQAQLAKIVSLTVGEIKKAEAGDLDLPQSFLRAIAKATGVTQISLINAEKPPKPKATKKPVGTPMLLTAQEKKVVRLFRNATDDQRSDAMRILNGEKTEVEQLVDAMLGEKWKKKLKK